MVEEDTGGRTVPFHMIQGKVLSHGRWFIAEKLGATISEGIVCSNDGLAKTTVKISLGLCTDRRT